MKKKTNKWAKLLRVSRQKRRQFITAKTQTRLQLTQNFSPWILPRPDLRGCPTEVSAVLSSTDTVVCQAMFNIRLDTKRLNFIDTVVPADEFTDTDRN